MKRECRTLFQLRRKWWVLHHHEEQCIQRVHVLRFGEVFSLPSAHALDFRPTRACR
jgi:hypothetical protein